MLRVLFQIHIPNLNGDHEEARTEPDKISDEALCAAVDYVEISTQHAAYIAGKDTIFKELEKTQLEGTTVCTCTIHSLLYNSIEVQL